MNLFTTVFFVMALVLWVAWSTSSADGHLRVALIGTLFFGAIYAIMAGVFPEPLVQTSVTHLLIFEASTIGTLLLFSELDGMAGMLELLMPVLVLLITSAGFIVRVVLRFVSET